MIFQLYDQHLYIINVLFFYSEMEIGFYNLKA